MIQLICRYAATTGLGEMHGQGQWGQVADPAWLQVFETVAFDDRVGAGAMVFGADAERRKQAGQVLRRHGFSFVPFNPRAVLQPMEKTQQIGSGDPVWMVFG